MKLLGFLTCEKVIIDINGIASLISLMGEARIQIAEGQELPPDNAVIPMAWAVFALWESTPEDIGVSYVQHMRILWPDGKEFNNTTLPFTCHVGKKNNHNVVNLIGFPVGQNGLLTIELWLEVDGKPITEVFRHTSLRVVTTLSPAKTPPETVTQ